MNNIDNQLDNVTKNLILSMEKEILANSSRNPVSELLALLY
ncbi:hypothetical protein [Romboutsia weinsteinii]|nr:hypothetical protein [Romboutsia weinsteinii]